MGCYCGLQWSLLAKGCVTVLDNACSVTVGCNGLYCSKVCVTVLDNV